MYTYSYIISVTYVKILMNVLAIMGIVNSCVIISMEATVAHVTVDINWIRIKETVQVLYWFISYCINRFTDINECTTGNGGCEQICTNNVPFFTCSCNSGFSLHNDFFCSGIYHIFL